MQEGTQERKKMFGNYNGEGRNKKMKLKKHTQTPNTMPYK